MGDGPSGYEYPRGRLGFSPAAFGAKQETRNQKVKDKKYTGFSQETRRWWLNYVIHHRALRSGAFLWRGQGIVGLPMPTMPTRGLRLSLLGWSSK